MFALFEAISRSSSDGATCSFSGGSNSKIHWTSWQANRYRHRKRFDNAIDLHLVDLDLSPDSLQTTHTKT